MTAAQLIAELSKLPPDEEVWVYDIEWNELRPPKIETEVFEVSKDFNKPGPLGPVTANYEAAKKWTPQPSDDLLADGNEYRTLTIIGEA